MSARVEEGYTLVESVVAMALMALVAGMVTAAYLLAARQFTRWQDRLALVNATHGVSQRLRLDLSQAAAVVLTPDSALALRLADDRPVRYTFAGDTLRRNGLRAHGDDVAVRLLSISGVPEEAEGSPLDSLVRVDVEAYNRAGRLAASVVVAPRAAPDWGEPDLDGPVP